MDFKHVNDELMGALIGLSRAAESKELLESSGEALVDGLVMTFCEADGDVAAMVSHLHAEKRLMAPDCAACQYPCGRTADYDMAEIYGASETLRNAKLELLEILGKVASSPQIAAIPEVRQFLSDSLFQISCTYEAGQLDAPITQAKTWLKQ